MELDKYRIKLTKNKVRADESLPGYSLSYKTRALDPNQACYEIISALAGDSDLVVELNTDLFGNSGSNVEDCAAGFLKDISSRFLAYGLKKFPSEQRQTFLGILMPGKGKKEAQRIAAYIPNKVWKDESFRHVLPPCGAMYYVLKEPADAEKLVADLFAMPEEEKAGKFRLIIFNMAMYGQMGITAYSAGEEELRSLLKSGPA